MRTLALVLAAASLAAACAATPPPNPPPPPPPPPDGDHGVAVLVPSDDPRLVRCGVDDRPRSVVGSLLPAHPRLAAESRAFLGDRAAPDPPAGAPMPMKPTIAREPPPQSPPIPRPPLLVTIELPRPVPGGAMPSGVGALRPDLAACDDLLEAGDAGTYGLEVAIASNGAPTEVRLSTSPSKFVRCAMERACQVRAAPGEASRVMLPLVIRAERPIAIPHPPPPPPPPPRVPLRVVVVRGEPALRDAAERAAGQCMPRDPSARVRIEIVFRRKSLGGNRVKPGETLERVSRVLEGADPDLVGCTMRTLLANGAPSPRERESVVEVTWNP